MSLIHYIINTFNRIKLCIFLLIATICTIVQTGKGQGKTNESKAFQILEKALGAVIENNNFAIYFEGIAYGIDQPLKIFKLPVYKVIRGGFFFVDGKKMEMQLGTMKNLSDGKLIVVVDETSKTMFVDSVRTTPQLDSARAFGFEKMMDETFGEGILTYEGEETINNKKCYKIKSSFNNERKNHVYYWVEVQTGQLYLMAEWQNSAYDVYWFRNVGKAPKNHDYSVNLPKKEMENFHGYSVIDNRYVGEKLRGKGVQ